MIVLDTHIWVRWVEPDTDPLPAAISRMIDSSDQVAVSAVSCWEVVYLAKRNRLMLPLPVGEWLQAALDESGVASLSLSSKDGIKRQRVFRISTVIRLTALS